MHKNKIAEELRPTFWQFVVFVFNIGIVMIGFAWFHYFYARGIIDLIQRVGIVIIFTLGAAICTVIAIEAWKEGTRG